MTKYVQARHLKTGMIYISSTGEVRVVTRKDIMVFDVDIYSAELVNPHIQTRFDVPKTRLYAVVGKMI